MQTEKKMIGVFVLAKNEDRNIARCLESLKSTSWDVVVLDSGSTDETAKIVAGFDFVEFRNYAYVDHRTAYNQITTDIGAGYQHVVILDADIVLSDALRSELNELLCVGGSKPQVVEAGILMYVDGRPLRFGSLCPPKPFVFAVGHEYFMSSGHGEKLREGLKPVRLRARLIHDDRKSYASYLQSQLRYSQNLVDRQAAGEVSRKDRLRSKTPLLIFLVPFASYVIKGGFLCGRLGIIYALDRVIAEAIMYRRSLSGVQKYP